MQRIVMHFGDTAVPGVLNDSETARAFAERLPVTIPMSGVGVDYCGRMPFDLPYDETDIHRGWHDGDINFNPGGGWFAVLFDDERNSRRYGDQLTMGRVEGSLEPLRSLRGSFDVLVERAGA